MVSFLKNHQIKTTLLQNLSVKILCTCACYNEFVFFHTVSHIQAILSSWYVIFYLNPFSKLTNITSSRISAGTQGFIFAAED